MENDSNAVHAALAAALGSISKMQDRYEALAERVKKLEDFRGRVTIQFAQLGRPLNASRRIDVPSSRAGTQPDDLIRKQQELKSTPAFQTANPAGSDGVIR